MVKIISNEIHIMSKISQIKANTKTYEMHNRISKLKVAKCVENITQLDQKWRGFFGICEVIILLKWKMEKYLFRNFLFNISGMKDKTFWHYKSFCGEDVDIDTQTC